MSEIGWIRADGKIKEILGDNFFEDNIIKEAFVTGTGLPLLDKYLGGGLYSGITEIYGPESVGKTLLIGHILAEAQRNKKITALCSSEYLDLNYLENIGVDLEFLGIIRGPNTKEILDVILDFSSEPDSVVAIDSLSALQSENGEYADWYNLMNYLTTNIHRINCSSCIVASSQVRQKKSNSYKKTFRYGTDSTAKNVRDFVTKLEISRNNVTDNTFVMKINIKEHLFSRPSKILEFKVEKGKPIPI